MPPPPPFFLFVVVVLKALNKASEDQLGLEKLHFMVLRKPKNWLSLKTRSYVFKAQCGRVVVVVAFCYLSPRWHTGKDCNCVASSLPSSYIQFLIEKKTQANLGGSQSTSS